jgi:5-formyltetrahydrofolate cyclo-ligase
MTSRDEVREKVRTELIKVAFPDSRYHLNTRECILDYRGSEKALKVLKAMKLYQTAKFSFVTPDNNLEKLRACAIQDGKVVLTTTYAIKRGFVILSHETVPKGQENYAALLDGQERLGRYVSLSQIGELVEQFGRGLDLFITGASVINTQGVRFGKGHGYADLEWAMLYEIGAVDESTTVIAFVHDVQLVEMPLEATIFDTVVDMIVTPTKVIHVEKPQKPRVGVVWKKLDKELFETIPPLQELWGMKEGGMSE